MRSEPVDIGGRRRAGEPGFSIVEVVIAALVLAVVIAGATAMFNGTQQESASVKVRDKQTALANAVLTKLQSDPTWATWCRTQPNPMRCDLTTWMRSKQYDQLGATTDASGSTNFSISAIATGTDLPADGLAPDDEDGLVPDVYHLTISVIPDADTRARNSGLKPFTVESEYNPTIRVDTGRVTVDACRALNQVDERMPVGDCYASTNVMKQLPPPTLDTSSASAIRTTCRGPVSQLYGSSERDCTAFKCASPQIAAPNPGLRTPCSSFPGWSPPSTWTGLEGFFTAVVTKPISGTIQLRNVRTGAMFGPVRLNEGRADFTKLPIGEYDVIAHPTDASRLWRSKSVPSTQRVAVEAGINSRAVLVYRPTATGHVSVPIRSVDGSIPWSTREWDRWVQIDDNGNVTESGGEVEVCLVPVPQGRLVGDDVPCQKFPMGVSSFDFTGVEPGLYSAQLSTGGYTRFMSLSGTAGFIWISEGGGAVTKLNGSTAPFEWVNGMCAKHIRETIVGTTVNPVTGTAISPVQPCNAGGSGGGPGGGGGGGTQ